MRKFLRRFFGKKNVFEILGHTAGAEGMWDARHFYPNFKWQTTKTKN